MMTDQSCGDFLHRLASAEPVPGGGGASALVGALGAALGSMVGNLTLGKKKYESVQEDIRVVLKKAGVLQEELLQLVQRDAEVFEPLSRAYGLPKETDEQRKKRDEIMEGALRRACSVPMLLMEKSLEAVSLHEELAAKGAKIAVSDVGVGVLFCKSALLGASLNVFINTRLMKDRGYAEAVNQKAEELIFEGVARADRVYRAVEDQLRGT